jgi:hypothetical protein
MDFGGRQPREWQCVHEEEGDAARAAGAFGGVGHLHGSPTLGGVASIAQNCRDGRDRVPRPLRVLRSSRR